MRESHKRSIIKAVSWRLLGSFSTTVIVFIFTGKLVLSLGVGLVEMISKVCFYYVHERIWEKIFWGKISNPLASLSLKKELKPEDIQMIREKLQELGYM